MFTLSSRNLNVIAKNIYLEKNNSKPSNAYVKRNLMFYFELVCDNIIPIGVNCVSLYNIENESSCSKIKKNLSTPNFIMKASKNWFSFEKRSLIYELQTSHHRNIFEVLNNYPDFDQKKLKLLAHAIY